MAYPELSSQNLSSGVYEIFGFASSIEPLFFPSILFALFMILLIGSYFSQKEFTGRATLSSSLAVSSFITTLAAFILNLIPNVLSSFVVGVWVVLTMIFVLFLFLPQDRG